MLPVILILGIGGLLLYSASKGGSSQDPKFGDRRKLINMVNSLRGKAGEDRQTIMGGINDGSLEEATGAAENIIEGFNEPPLEGAASGFSAGLALGGPLAPITAVVGAVIGAFAQNIVRLVEGSDVGDVIDGEIKKALKSAGMERTPSNITFARHMLVLKQYAGELSTDHSRLAAPVRGHQFDATPEHSWGILFRRWMGDYLFGHADNEVQHGRAPRSATAENRSFLGIPMAGRAATPAAGWWELEIKPGWKKCKLVRAYPEAYGGAGYERFEKGETVLRADSEALNAYAEQLSHKWSGVELMPPVQRGGG